MISLTREEATIAWGVLGNVCRQTSHLVPITQELVDLVDQLQAALLESAAEEAPAEETPAE